MKKLLAVAIILLFIGMSVIPSTGTTVKKTSISSFDGKTLYVGGSGEGNYTRIQDAINDASDGDTIFVYAYSSPYFENIVIIKSINLIGEDKNSTVIDGNNRGIVVNIFSDFVNISEFSIINSGRGINIRDSQSCNIKYNKLYNHNEGIVLFNFANYGNNTYYGNTIRACIQGITIYESTNDYIINNTFINCSGNCMHLRGISHCEITGNIMENCGAGISLSDFSNDNIISKNTINNTYDRGGISIGTNFGVICYDNIITNNTLSNCKKDGIFIAAESESNTVSGNTIFENEHFGISIIYSESNHVTGNTIISNTLGGLHLFYSKNNIISKNYINNNSGEGGILMSKHSGNNQILLNQIENNTIGINLNNSKHNKIKNNNIMKNKIHDAIFYGTLLNRKNKWIRNYWGKAKFLPKIIIGRIGPKRNIPWLNLDWHPAKEPHDIGV